MNQFLHRSIDSQVPVVLAQYGRSKSVYNRKTQVGRFVCALPTRTDPMSSRGGQLFALLLSSGGLNQTSFDGSVAVVGNGPISHADRTAIESHQIVVRFNDVNYMHAGERTTIHVVREPTSLKPKVPVSAPIWAVSPVESYVPADAAWSTPVYERQYKGQNWISDDAVIFPQCGGCADCLQSGTFAGPSTGAVALSELNELEGVSKIDVFGMNWNGPARIHIDFNNRTLVHDCCHKCVFNETHSDYYGTGLTIVALLLIVFGGAGLLSCMTGVFVETTAPVQRREALPLLSMPLDMEPVEKDEAQNAELERAEAMKQN